MYSLDVNFLNDRTQRLSEVAAPVRRRAIASDNPRPMYLGLAIGAFLPALVGGLWFWAQSQNNELLTEQQRLDQELQALQAQLAEVAAAQKQVSDIQAQNRALAAVFDRIQPWSAILQDIRNRIPAGVQIANIAQTTTTPPAAPAPAPAPAPAASPGASPAAAAPPPPEVPAPVSTVVVEGNARTFNDVNDLLLVLQQSPFLDREGTRLETAELVRNPATVEFQGEQQPNFEVRLPDVVRFRITATLTDRPASELLQDLRDTLAVGLPARIDALRDLGVVTP